MAAKTRTPPTPSQWAAIRALAEGALPTRARLAAAIGVSLPAISKRAGREAWRTLDFRRADARRLHAAFVTAAGAGRG